MPHPETTTPLPFPVGTRVRLTTTIEQYPYGIFEEGETGTVGFYSNGDTICYVKLDKHDAALDEWENCLEICDWQTLNNSEGDDRIIDQIEAVK